MAGTDDHTIILRLQNAWIAAETADRVDDLCALMTPDIIFQPPVGTPVVGRARVRDYLAADSPPIHRIILSEVAVELSGALAVKRAAFRTEFASGAVVAGRHLWVLRAPWRVAFVTWSFDSQP
ncbi:nuclear transport factor 2 family protein [Brevundimonas sp. 2R-24]|uniref:Nuclear transport factor 2 family protein n=1 Tax=Peiella sedimenti TaxID=3061083 RepID=A0ABT8SKY6_9CAUL|nr:nuclear transport factor 2 family protein [Caulobacteraceae bacterium XZ-24]